MASMMPSDLMDSPTYPRVSRELENQRGPGAAVEAAPLASVLSATQVATFQSCSAAWWFRYGLGLREPATASQALGRAVHAAIEANFVQKVETGRDLPLGEVLAEYRQAWAEGLAEVEFREEEDVRAILADGEQLVGKYLREAAPAIQPAAVEVFVDGAIGGVPVRGRVDLIDVDGRIVDVKTAQKRPCGVSAAQMFQLATYQQLTGDSRQARVDTLVRTKPPALVQITRTLSDEDLRITQTIYPLAQDAMRSGLYLPNRGSLFCSRRNCAFWRACEREYGGAVEES